MKMMGQKVVSQTTKIYRKLDDTQRLMIEVSLDNYEDMFNEWDPAPFKRRDIDPDLRTFFKECSDEIGLKHPIAIVFYLPKQEVDLEKQRKCIEGLRNFFLFNQYLTQKEIKSARKDALRYFAIGVIFLAIAVTLEKFFEKTLLLGVLGQGLFIGGWVFAWEALSIVVFKKQELSYTMSEWERFLDAPIVFKKEEPRQHVNDEIMEYLPQ